MISSKNLQNIISKIQDMKEAKILARPFYKSGCSLGIRIWRLLEQISISRELEEEEEEKESLQELKSLLEKLQDYEANPQNYPLISFQGGKQIYSKYDSNFCGIRIPQGSFVRPHHWNGKTVWITKEIQKMFLNRSAALNWMVTDTLPTEPGKYRAITTNGERLNIDISDEIWIEFRNRKMKKTPKMYARYKIAMLRTM